MAQFVPGLLKGGLAGGGIPFAEHKDREADGSNLTTYNGFKAFDIGAAHPSRLIVAGVSWQSDQGNTTTRAISSMTIGGVSATVHATQQETGFTNPLGCSLVTAAVPTGTTASPVVTMDGGCLFCEVSMFRTLFVMDSTPFDTDGDLTDTIDMSLNIPQHGIGIGYGLSVGGTPAVTITGLTEAYDVTDLTSGGFFGAVDDRMLSETGRTITIDESGSPSGMLGICGSWR